MALSFREAVDAKANSQLKKKNRKEPQYFRATRKSGGGISKGSPYSNQAAAIRAAKKGKDVYTFNAGDAKELAILASDPRLGEVVLPHGPHDSNGQYVGNQWHYHLAGHVRGDGGAHIFFGD